MINLISAIGAFDIIVAVTVTVAVIAVIGRIIYKKATGKGAGCCDCGCNGCTACDKCRTQNTKTK